MLPRVSNVSLAALALLAAATACESPSAPADPAPFPGDGAISIGEPKPLYESVSVDDRGFLVDGQYKLLRGGTVQWFRMPPEVWDDRLRRFKAAGFNTIEMYVAWNQHEPTEGVFDFETRDLRGFLELAKAHGLYVYFRPGPYITNELDGGGVPAWLFTKTSKKNKDADGLVNLRTNDPDYLAYVERYFDALNEVVRPYLITNGGPIILYSIENEYDWFEIFHDVDKLFWYRGGPERNTLETPDTRGYLAALRDMVLGDGIDVPITTCPGDAKVGGMGDVEGVIPMPNVYKQGNTENIAYDIITSMHDPAQFGGAYVDYPTGSTETDRTATRMKRLFMGGMDGSFHFNIAGMAQDGYNNAVVLDNSGPKSAFDLSLDNITNAFLSPTVGYFHNVIDYFGAISPSGALRTKFHDFRRTNLLFDAFEARLGAVRHPQKNDPRVSLDHGALAADYWLDAGGVYFVSLVNESSAPQTVPTGALTIDGARVPQFEPMLVPAADYPGMATDGGTELENASIVVANLPLTDADDGLELAYSTGEVLTLRRFNDRTLLMLHGVAGSRGELALRGNYTVASAAPGFADRGGVFTFGYGAPQRLTLTTAGETIDVVVLDRARAGRTWFHHGPGAGDDYAVVGIDYVTDMTLTDGRLDIAYEHEGERLDLWTLSATGASTRTVALGPDAPALPDVLAVGKVAGDRAEAELEADTAAWTEWTGQPRPLEELGILRGHAWYRAEFDIDGEPNRWWKSWPLWVEHASDFVGIYVNGQYVTTVAPHGTHIDSRSYNPDYRLPDLKPYLRRGKNVLAFRVEVWGHGSFMWPRGFMIGNRASLPSLGFDSVKGLWGEARVGDLNLDRWSARAELGGERRGVFAPGYDDSAWPTAQVPLALEPGDIRWYRTSFSAGDLPDPARFHAPAVLHLEGRASKATIYLNGRLIGRWLSDTGWLRQGTWARPTRDMWMNTPPDDFPISVEALRPGENQLAIAFEEASRAGEEPGVVERIELRYHREARGNDGERTTKITRLTHRGLLTVE